MLLSSSELKKESRQALHKNWLRSIILIFIYFFIAIFITKLLNSFIGALVSIFISYPLLFGLINYFIKQANKQANFLDFFSMFTSFKKWIKAIGIQITFLIGLFLSAIPSIILFIFFLEMSFSITPDNGQPGITLDAFLHWNIIIFLTLMALFVVPIILYSYTYSQIIFVYIEKGTTLNIKNIFKESRYLMKGNKFNLFKFQLSYIGWFALGLTPIFLFWYSFPYFSGIRESYFIPPMLLSCIWFKFQLSYVGWFALGLTPIFLFWYSLPYFSGIRELYFILPMLLSCIWYLWFFSYFYQGLTIFYLKISKTTIEDNEEVIEC